VSTIPTAVVHCIASNVPLDRSVCGEYKVDTNCYVSRNTCWDNALRPCGVYICTPGGSAGSCTQTYLGGGAASYFVKQGRLDASTPECPTA
jgi:hypothetical protein